MQILRRLISVPGKRRRNGLDRRAFAVEFWRHYGFAPPHSPESRFLWRAIKPLSRYSTRAWHSA
jgi:hypothetical protein